MSFSWFKILPVFTSSDPAESKELQSKVEELIKDVNEKINKDESKT